MAMGRTQGFEMQLKSCGSDLCRMLSFPAAECTSSRVRSSVHMLLPYYFGEVFGFVLPRCKLSSTNMMQFRQFSPVPTLVGGYDPRQDLISFFTSVRVGELVTYICGVSPRPLVLGSVAQLQNYDIIYCLLTVPSSKHEKRVSDGDTSVPIPG